MNNKKLISVTMFAIAMACIEAATVVYLRNIYGIQDLILDIPVFDSSIAPIELCRELATLLMLLTLGWSVGKSLQSRLGFTFFTFGIWDIFYYFWLRVFINWPNSLLDMDLLFLIPLPWWGPVLAPVLIAILMIVWGIMAVVKDQKGEKINMFPLEWVGLSAGILTLLYSFMKDAIAIYPTSYEKLNAMRPSDFSWQIYLFGLLLSGYGVFYNFQRMDQKE